MREDASVVAAALPLDASGEDVDVGAAAPSLERTPTVRASGAAVPHGEREGEVRGEGQREASRGPRAGAAPLLVSAGTNTCRVEVAAGGSAAAAASGPMLRIAQGSWGDAAFATEARRARRAPPRAPSAAVEPEPPDGARCRPTRCSAAWRRRLERDGDGGGGGAISRHLRRRWTCLGLDAGPAASAAPVPDLLGGFDQLASVAATRESRPP